MQDLSPRQQAKHDQITDAAIEVFAEKGFHHARVSDIAKRAGVADGTIYLYFKNKEDLLISIFEEKMDALLVELSARLEGIDDPAEQLVVFASFHAEQVHRHPALAQVLQLELRLSNKFLKAYRPTKLWAYVKVLQTIVTDAQAKGMFRDDVDPFVIMWAVFGALDGLGMQWVLSRRARQLDPEHTARLVADVFLRGLLRATEPPTQLEAS